jgi:hypothetical protein
LNSRNPKIQAGVLWIIAALSADDEKYRDKCGSTTIRTLVELLQSKDIKLRVGAIEALCNVSIQNEHNCNVIVREGGIKPLLASFKIKKAIVKEWVASTLCNIAYSNEQNCASIESEGGVKALIELVKDSSENVVLAGLAALRNLVGTSRRAATNFVDGGGIYVLLDTLRPAVENNFDTHSAFSTQNYSEQVHDEEIIAAVVSVFCNLAFKNEPNCKRIGEQEGLLKMFLDLLPRYKNNVEIQFSILSTLHNLSQYEPNCKILLQLKALRIIPEFEKSPHLELRDPAAKIITFVKSYQDQEELSKKAGIGFKPRKTNGSTVEPLNLDKAKQSSSTARSILSPRDVQAINSKNDVSARGSQTHREGQHNRSLSTEAQLSSERDGRKSEDRSHHQHNDEKDKKHKSSRKKDSSREGKDKERDKMGLSAERLEVSDHKSERRKSDRRKSEKRRSIDAGTIRSKSPSGESPTNNNINNVNLNNTGTEAETRRHKHRSDRHKKEELSEKKEDKMNNANINNASSGEKVNGSDKA